MIYYAAIFLTVLSCVGLITASVALFRQRKKLEELRCNLNTARHEAEDIVQFIMHNPYPFIQFSPDGKILFANPAAHKEYPDLATEELDHPLLGRARDFLKQQKQKTETCEVTIDDKTWYQTMAPVVSSGGKGLAVYCYDVSERKEFEKKLEKSRKAAETANRAKSDFLANMSHELRTPMNGIIGLSGLLMKMEIGEKPQQLSKAVHSSSRNLLALLNDILDFSKIEASELTLENIPFDIRSVICQISSLQNPIAVEKGLVLNGTVDETVPARLMGDPARLQQILNNLVSNALKFTEKGSITINVKSRPTGEDTCEIYISVRDTGIGIPADKKEVIFNKFTQADISTARKYGGTGLGLTITKQLTDMMGGTVDLESEEGTGTTFHVKIPAQIAEHEAVAETQQESVTTTINKNARIMVVDDHPVNLLYMRGALEDFGFAHITEAKSGREALEMFQANPCDLILMDCQMPDMDGYDASKLIREKENAKNPPVIVAVTADAMKGAQEKCLAAGMDDYLSKPVETGKLSSILQKWLPEKSGQKIVNIHSPEQTNNKETQHTIFDHKRLYTFTKGDPEKEREIITLFSENAEKDLKALQTALEDQDHQAWEKCAHKLYGSSINFGAINLAVVCDNAQELDSGDQEKKERLFAKIIMNYKQLNQLLQSRKNAA